MRDRWKIQGQKTTVKKSYRLFHALVGVEATVAELSKARRAHALVGPLRVHTLVLAHVLPRRALVHVAAGAAVRVEHVALRARAGERAERVGTLVFTGSGSLQALVHVIAARARSVRLETAVADAP